MAFELVAVGPKSSETWRRKLKPDLAVRIGRQPANGWAVPWEAKISKEHADLLLDDGRLHVNCLPSAQRTTQLRGKSVITFSVGAGESFRIGETVFEFVEVSSRGEGRSSSAGRSPADRSSQGRHDRPDELPLPVPPRGVADLPSMVSDSSPVSSAASSVDELRVLWQSEVKLRRKAEEHLAFREFELARLRGELVERNAAVAGVPLRAETPIRSGVPEVIGESSRSELRVVAEQLRRLYGDLDERLAQANRLLAENQALRAELTRLEMLREADAVQIGDLQKRMFQANMEKDRAHVALRTLQERLEAAVMTTGQALVDKATAEAEANRLAREIESQRVATEEGTTELVSLRALCSHLREELQLREERIVRACQLLQAGMAATESETGKSTVSEIAIPAGAGFYPPGLAELPAQLTEQLPEPRPGSSMEGRHVADRER